MPKQLGSMTIKVLADSLRRGRGTSWQRWCDWFVFCVAYWLGLSYGVPEWWPKHGMMNITKVLNAADQDFHALMEAMSACGERRLEWLLVPSGRPPAQPVQLTAAQNERFVQFLTVYLEHSDDQVKIGYLHISRQVADVISRACDKGHIEPGIVLLQGCDFEPDAEQTLAGIMTAEVEDVTDFIPYDATW